MIGNKIEKTEGINEYNKSIDIGRSVTRGGIVVLDQLFGDEFSPSSGELSSQIHVGTGGNILFQNSDDEIIPYLNVTSGTILWVAAKKVVSSATIKNSTGQLQNYTTTATNITWHGGK